jgi:UPF0755 protein
MTPVSPQTPHHPEGGQRPSQYDAPSYPQQPQSAEGDAGLGQAFEPQQGYGYGPAPVPPPPDPWAPPPLAAASPSEGAYGGDLGQPTRGGQPPRNPLILPSPDKEKPRRRRSRVAHSQFLSLLSGFITVTTLVAALVFLVLNEVRRDYFAKGPLAEVKTVVVPKSSGTRDIYDLLVKAGVIRDEPVFISNAFQIGLFAFSGGASLKAGEWEFQPGMSMSEVVNHLDSGKPVVHRITFPEGWTSEQIVGRLTADPVLTGRIAAVPEEGTILPNTYQFSLGDSRQKILDEMRKAQERELKAIWEKRDPGLPLATMRDMVILASIVEKETGKADERPHVAGVFINRLKRNMRLETDPTIIYGLYKGASWTEPRTLTKSEMAAPNPYNTYKINGLPPGPIANPGRAALEAVANPMKTDDIFFVADGNGGHVFAATLAEHNKNVAALRALEAQRGQPSSPAMDTAPAPAPAPASPARPAATPRPAAPAAAAPAPARPAAPAAAPAAPRAVTPVRPRPVEPPAVQP